MITPPSQNIAIAVAAIAAVSLLTGSCAKGPVCKDLASCGGNPVGKWAQRPTAESGSNYCQESLHRPPLTEYLQGQPTPVARTPVPESTNLDWCYNLVLTANDTNPLKKHLYYWENLIYLNGLLTYEDNGTYQLDFGRLGRMHAYYSRTCLSQYGHTADCANFERVLTEANQGAGEYFDFKCTDNAAKGGCDCYFQVSEADAQGGVYDVRGSTLTHFPTSNNARFSQVSLCVQGEVMQMTGKDNSYLWDRPGLRTMEFVRVHCDDGFQGPGELGVDCGFLCPNACP
jgi:hypothetical protein